MFRAIFLSKPNDQFTAAVSEVSEADLPVVAAHHAVRLRVEYSSLNYKDGLAITNRGPVVRRWPMVPGIDGAGIVEYSDDPLVHPRKSYLINGFGIGETHWGCLSEIAQLDSRWLIALPETLSARDAMALGTAGYTAMLCVMALEEHHIKPDSGAILVTGATGGVGSFAVSLLAGLGYEVTASTGRPVEEEFLRSLGAKRILDRATLTAPGKPLQKEQWAGVIDVAGSHTLANACAQVQYGGVVAACGLAQGMDFPTTVAPFILRAVKLVGIDSVNAPTSLRQRAWTRLASEMNRVHLASITQECSLGDAVDMASKLMAGELRGRVVVDVRR